MAAPSATPTQQCSAARTALVGASTNIRLLFTNPRAYAAATAAAASAEKRACSTPTGTGGTGTGGTGTGTGGTGTGGTGTGGTGTGGTGTGTGGTDDQVGRCEDNGTGPDTVGWYGEASGRFQKFATHCSEPTSGTVHIDVSANFGQGDSELILHCDQGQIENVKVTDPDHLTYSAGSQRVVAGEIEYEDLLRNPSATYQPVEITGDCVGMSAPGNNGTGGI